MPAGQLRFAAGLDYREQRYRFTPDPLLDVLSTSDAPIGQFPTGATKGAINVKEVYGELLVPLLKDVPLFKALNLELGGRYSDYNTAGEARKLVRTFTSLKLPCRKAVTWLLKS